MKEIPLKVLARQSLSVMLEQSLYEIALKECNGIMAATIIRDGVVIVENRRCVAGMTIIPEGYLEEGNFVILTEKGEIPYYTGLGTTDVLVYLTIEEVNTIRNMYPLGPEPNSIPSGPLTDFNYMTSKISDGMAFSRASIGTYIKSGQLLTAAVNIPRFEDNGLLIENNATNLLVMSDPNGANWITNGTGTITNEGNELIKIVGTATTDGKYFTLLPSFVAGKSYTFSCWLNVISGKARVGFQDVTDGSIITDGPTPGLQRVSITIPPQSTSTLPILILYCYDGPAEIIVGRVQVEEGILATSYIKTEGATASRSKDVVTLTQSPIVTVYREYISSDMGLLVKELVIKPTQLIYPGHLQRLVAWNRELTDEEKKPYV